MAGDTRTYIRVHDGMPDHPKIEALSDKAFRVLVETWCWSSRHLTDGRVPLTTWRRRATPRIRRELVAAGLVEESEDAVQMHDYLEHQRSRATVEEISAARREALQKASEKANHTRWHVGPKGKPSADCSLCRSSDSGSPADPKRKGSGSVDNSRSGQKSGHTKVTGSETETDTDKSLQTRTSPNLIRTSRGPAGTTDGADSDRTPIGSHIGRDRGRDREGGGDLGGERPDSNARDFQTTPTPTPIFDPEHPRCARHAHIPPGQPVPNCRDCGDIRQQARAMAADEAAAVDEAKADHRARVEACEVCDENGMRPTSLGLARCTHPELEPAT